MQGRFSTATDDEITEGRTTDVYFVNTLNVLRKKRMSKAVAAEFTVSKLPGEWGWGLYAGLDELLTLFEGVNVDLYSIPNGTVFHSKDTRGVNVPVAMLHGDYATFCVYETPALGLICHASGIATTAARLKTLLLDKRVLSFGVRRIHPAISPFVDKYAYVGGCDAVSSLKGAEVIGQRASGTMPHSLILMFGDQRRAFKAFNDVIAKEIPRVALADTLADEKFEALMAAETLGKNLTGVRLDTHSSRRGRFEDIVAEVRWELNLRGYKDVKIAVSGGLNEKTVPGLKNAGADIFGIGTSISNAQSVDFALDIIEIAGKPFAKRGKFAGRKEPLRCDRCFAWRCVPFGASTNLKCQKCGGKMRPMLRKVVEKGKVIAKPESASEVRKRVLDQISRMSEADEGLRCR